MLFTEKFPTGNLPQEISQETGNLISTGDWKSDLHRRLEI